jgi:hypothetical protein
MSVEIMALAEQLSDPELLLFGHFLRVANALEHDDILTTDAEVASFTRQMAEIQAMTPPQPARSSKARFRPALCATMDSCFSCS